ncbi:MAG TPA: flagellar hook-associated protein FlgL [Bacteroidota bacterium]|nr:flagellar hook-associated protein FlgL [Bacteroidota bacterium]
MRITENSLVSQFLGSLNTTRERIVDLQDQLSSGKAVEKSSDDPVAMSVILRLQNSLDRNAQFQKNVSDASNMIDNTQSALGSFTDILTQLKSILATANNTTAGDSLPALADQVDSLLTEAVNVANTQFNGKYLFGGTNTLDPPFQLAADHSAVTANPAGITGAINYQIGEGTTQAVNIDGQEAFQGTQMFDLMIQLRDSLQSGTIPAAASMDSVSTMMDHLVAESGKAGAISQLLSTNQTLLEDQNTQLESLRSNYQDTDVAEATMQMKQAEVMLESALNTGAQIIPQSLIDYMK